VTSLYTIMSASQEDYSVPIIDESIPLLIYASAISGDLLSAVISTCYILGFRKDNTFAKQEMR
jgi:hypothetical protein